MSWFSSWLHPQNGYKAAQGELNKYYDQSQGFLQPYNQNGVTQGQNLNEYIKQLMNPQQLQDQWSNGYKESDSAKNMENLAQQHGLNAAESLGLNGSNTALNAIQSGTSQIAAEDKQNYLKDLMEKYKTGAGLSESVYGTGANAANNQSQNAARMGENSAGLKFGETNAPGQKFGQIGSSIGQMIADYLTGGFGKGGGGRGAWSTGGS